MTISFTDRVAIITGAGNGLGRSHALMLAARGARVVVNDLGGAVDGTGASTTPAEAVVAEIRANGGEAVANYDSVTDEEGARRIAQAALDAWGRIDILINNAGVLRDKTLAKMPLDWFRFVMDVHVMGAVNCTQAVWAAMKDQGYGRIVMTSSGAGMYGNFGQANYGAAKMALVGLMNVLKQEGRKNGILVNTVAPIAATRMTAELMPQHTLEYLKSEYISAAAAWLASEACTQAGLLMSAGAGYFALARLEEGAGTYFDVGREPVPEMVEERFAEISDFSAARPYGSAQDYLDNILARFAPKS
jgi:NAD(P)-dependent dehydrogenase (short-subunit alcohol dehydrogenase family)